MQETLLITILVLIVAYIAFIVFFPKVIPEESSQHTKDALKSIYDEAQQQQDALGEQKVLKDVLSEENAIVRGFFSIPLLDGLYPLVLQSGLSGSTNKIVVVFIALMVGLMVGLPLAGVDVIIALVAVPILAYLLMKKFLTRKIKKRNEKFVNQFPDVLDIFVRSVKSGFPIATALKMVAENSDSPVREEFEQIVNELSIGQSINQSLSRLAQRINEPDIHFFVVVMKVQQETGGNLAEVIGNLSNVIRKRKQLRLKIRAMTSEGRATATILGSLPVIVFAALSFTNREYVEVLWTTDSGMMALAVAAALVFGAVTVVNKMIAIDI